MQFFPYERLDPPPAKNNELVYAKQGGLFRESEAGLVGALPSLIGRQGGSATVWATPGETNRTVEAACIQVGVASVVTSAFSVTFPTPFATAPVVVVSIKDAAQTVYLVLTAVSSTGFSIALYDDAGSGADTSDMHWMAIGTKV